MVHTVPVEHDIERTYELLGGIKTIRKPVRNSLEAHDALKSGLPSSALLHLASQIASLSAGLDAAIGISMRTLQRCKKDAKTTVLSVEQSNRTWKFAEILGRTIETLGSKEEAEAWMNRPAIGLEQRKPIDLLATSAGIEAVEDYLTRIEYGMYA